MAYKNKKTDSVFVGDDELPLYEKNILRFL